MRYDQNAELIRAAGQAFSVHGCNVEVALVGDLEVLTLDKKDDLQASMNRDPLLYQEAMSSMDFQRWKLATLEEWGAILDNGTFQDFKGQSETRGWVHRQEKHLKGQQPLDALAGMEVISSKWVYKKKINPDGTTRYKVCLVIRGFELVEGTDYGETYAPVSKLTTFRMLLSLAARHGWTIDYMDVTTAFLNPEIDWDEVYMSLPPGMEWIDTKLYNQGVHIVRLRKALYGLRQALKLWLDEINGFLLSIGFKPSSADLNLYIKGSVLLLLYVDDMIIIVCRSPKDAYLGNLNRPTRSPKDAKASSAGAQIQELLTAKYKMTDLGETRRFLRIEVMREDNGITLAQNRYIDAILRRFRTEEAHEVRFPMDPNVQLDNSICKDCKADNALYLSIVGSVMYVALATHPDISYCVTSLSRYNKDPLHMHLTAAKRVLRYLKHTRYHGIYYSKDSHGSTMGLTDSDWAGRVATQKSVRRCIFFGAPGSGPIHWQVKAQSVVALSTLDAEYIACSDATRETLWLRELKADILKVGNSERIPRTVCIASDNQGALKLIATGVTKQKKKHIAVKYHHSHEEQLQGHVTISYVHTSQNAANHLTKPLATFRHEELVQISGIRQARGG